MSSSFNKSENSLYSIVTQKYYQSIFNYCYVQLGNNRQAAEDCTQEVFLKLFEKWKRINKEDNIRAWLYKTAAFVLKNYFRKNKIKIENLDDFSEIIDIKELEKEAINSDSSELIASLSDEEKDFIEQYYVNEIPARDLAKSFDVSEEVIYKRVSRIKNKLLLRFEKNKNAQIKSNTFV